MTKDDKKIVRNVILFCVIFSVFFTGYRVFSLLEDKKEENEGKNNNQLMNNQILTNSQLSNEQLYNEQANIKPSNNINNVEIEDNNVINTIADLDKQNGSVASPYTNINNMLYEATINGDFESVRRYINMGADINSTDDNGSSIVYRMAIFKNLSLDQLNCLNYLLLKGADANKENNNGYTPLTAHLSSNNFDKEFLNRLIANNVEVNYPDFDGNTPLHYATMNNNLNAVEYLLENGANTNVKNKDGITPLHIAVKTKNYDIVAKLLSFGADRNTKDINGISALDIVKTSNDVDLLKLFNITKEDIKKDKLLVELQEILINNISKPAVKSIKDNVDKGFYNRSVLQDKGSSTIEGKFVGESPTPLITALYFGYNDIAKSLINIGADINKPNNYPYYSPLMVAAENGNKEMVNILLQKGANINYKSEMDGITALNVTNNVEIAELILKANADPNTATNNNCISPLQMAVINNNYDLAEVLLKYGADVNHVDCKEYKPVIANAIDTGNPAIVRLLLNYNAGVNTEVGEDISIKVIDYAIQKGNQLIVDMINEKLQLTEPKKEEVAEDSVSPLIKNNVKDNIVQDNSLNQNKTRTLNNNENNNITNEIDNIMNDIVNGL